MDTLGGLVDKLITADLKMWNAQEDIYEIRHMSFDEFKQKFFHDEAGAEKIWQFLKKACDLNLQRNQLIDEVDQKVVEIVKAAMSGEELDAGKFIQNKFKTY